MTIDFRQFLVEPANRCLVIAEIAQAHDGSLGTAHAYIDAVASAGADAVKFQTHIAEAESTPHEPWRIKFSPQDATRFEYWKRMEFTKSQWQGLKDHADQRGLIFLSSPFSEEAIELLTDIGVSAWKIASGEVTNPFMFEKMVATGLPFLLSSGMSNLAELDAAVALIREHALPLAILQCTTAYPCPPEKVGLNMLDLFRDRYQCAVGLSDHSGTIYAGLAAATLGIELLEIHVTFSREMFGPDVPASITTSELQTLVEGIRFIEKMKAHPVDKEVMATELEDLRRVFTKSVVARVELPVGTRLKKEHLALRKPGNGFPATRVRELLNRKLKRSVVAGAVLHENDIED